jgi:hypothetical protein
VGDSELGFAVEPINFPTVPGILGAKIIYTHSEDGIDTNNESSEMLFRGLVEKGRQ